MAKTESKRAHAGDVESDDTLDTSGSEAAYNQLLETAEQLPEAEVLMMRADPGLALYNVHVGLEAIKPHRTTLSKELPKLDQGKIETLERRALAVNFAAAQVDRHAGTGKNVAVLLRRARDVRDLLMSTADAMAKAGLIPAPPVKKIQGGRGQFDTADDLVQLAALFRKHAEELKGKSPLSSGVIKEASELGTELLGVLRPSSAKRTREATPELARAVDVRDRLWTLLVQGHRELRRAGMWIWVDDVDEHVPPLQSRAKKTKKSEGEEPTEPGGQEPHD